VLSQEQELAPHQQQPITAEAAIDPPTCNLVLTPVNESPRVLKMLEKHPAVKVDWRVPEPIKAAGETLRGVLIISVKDVASDLKSAAAAGVTGKSTAGTKTNNKIKRSHVAPAEEANGMLSPERAKSANSKRQSKLNKKTVTVEHIEINLTGVEGKKKKKKEKKRALKIWT